MAQAADSSAILSWQPVTQLMDGQNVTYPMRYQVQRSKDNVGFSNVGEAKEQTQFLDAALNNGETYYYKVQSILMVDGNAVNGGLSDVVSVTAIDQMAPATPTGVTVVQTAGGIKIFWDKSRETDVKGYRVYRRGADEKVSKQIGDVSGVYSIFEDTDVSADGSYFYSVTAYDQMEVPNESDKSQEAGVRH